MKIYVKDAVRKPNDTLYTFLYRVLGLDGNGWRKLLIKATYTDPELTKLQCISNKYRSFDDLVLISKTYFKVSNKAVAKVIKKILDKYDSTNLVLCDSAKKWIFHWGLNSDYIKYCANYNESHKKTHNPGVGVHSFDDIITLMELTKEDIKINN
jgi:hypothetical protein